MLALRSGFQHGTPPLLELIQVLRSLLLSLDAGQGQAGHHGHHGPGLVRFVLASGCPVAFVAFRRVLAFLLLIPRPVFAPYI